MKYKSNRYITRRYKKNKIRIFFALFLSVTVIAAAIFIIYGSRHDHIEAGQYNISDIYPGENLRQSLDLQLAAKAQYPSSPISVVKKLSTSDGITEQLFSFKVPVDTLTEYGLMMMPAGQPPAQGFPVIILLHGYSNPSKYLTEVNYVGDMEFYARHGFAVFKPDYRGQGFTLHQGEPNSAYYSMDYNTDVMSLISAVKQTKYIDKSQINLWGHSMGAYIALRASVQSHDIKNLILVSGPVDSLNKMYLTYIPPSDENNLNALKTRQEVFNRYGTPAEDTAFWRNASPITFISKITAHIQIHVGELDQTVPPQFSADLDAALSRNHISHEYYVYQYGEHSLIEQRPLVWARTLKVLQPQPAPVTPSV